MKKKQMLSGLLALSMMSSLVAGCAGNKPAATPAATPGTSATTTPAPATDEPVEITFWNYPNYAVVDGTPGKYEEGLVAAFNEKYPNIKVNVEMISFDGGPEKLSAAIASNSQPDLVYDYPGRIIDYARQGIMAPLDDMFGEIKDIPESVMKASSLDGKVYMYPINTAPFVLGVNKTLVEKAGLVDRLHLDDPERIWTIDEYTAFLKDMKKALPDVYPMGWYSTNTGGDQGTRAFIRQIYGASVLKEDMSEYTLNSPEGVKGLQWVVDGIKDGIIAPGSEAYKSNDIIGLFLQEKVAVTPIYSAVLRKTNASAKVGEWEDILMPLPVPKAGDKPSLEAFIGGIGIFDNGDAAKVDAAKKFVDFLANDAEWGNKNLISTGGLSVRSSITGLYGDDKEAAFAEKMVQYIGQYYNAVPGFAEMRTYWFPEIQNATLGTKTPQQALDTYVQKANETLKK